MTTRETIRRRWGSTKKMVWGILKDSEKARNSDKWLILKALALLGEDITIWNKEKPVVKWQIPLDHLDAIPNFESIRRCRAEIQNKDQEWLPTDQDVIQARGVKEEVIKTWYAHQPQIVRDWEDRQRQKEQAAEEQDEQRANATITPYCGKCGAPINVRLGSQLCKLCEAVQEMRR